MFGTLSRAASKCHSLGPNEIAVDICALNSVSSGNKREDLLLKRKFVSYRIRIKHWNMSFTCGHLCKNHLSKT